MKNNHLIIKRMREVRSRENVENVYILSCHESENWLPSFHSLPEKLNACPFSCNETTINPLHTVAKAQGFGCFL